MMACILWLSNSAEPSYCSTGDRKALQKLHKGELVRVQASGRTDSTVHAKGQVIHFDTPLSLEEWQWSNALNTMLPDDIVIRQVEKTEEFHARYGVEKRISLSCIIIKDCGCIP